MTDKSTNCVICAQEFNSDDLQSIASSKINVTRFKICQSCLDACDPAEDYHQAREIISNYLWFAETKNLLKEASDILEDVNSAKNIK
jgi:hypothetical protein